MNVTYRKNLHKRAVKTELYRMIGFLFIYNILVILLI